MNSFEEQFSQRQLKKQEIKIIINKALEELEKAIQKLKELDNDSDK